MTGGVLVLGVVTMFCWGLAAVFDKLSLDHLSPKAYFFLRLWLAALLFLVPTLALVSQKPPRALPFDARSFSYVLGSIVFTYSGMILYYFALSAGAASKIVPFCAAYPAVTFLCGIALLREPFSASALAGTILVAAGTFLLSR